MRNSSKYFEKLDFRLAATNGILDPGGFTKQFASSNVFAKQDRCAMDDMESLLFTIWYVAGVPQDRKFYIGPRQPEGLVLYNGYRNGKANDKMLVYIVFHGKWIS